MKILNLGLASDLCQGRRSLQFALDRQWALSTMQLGYVWLIAHSTANTTCVEQFVAKVFLSNQYSTRYADEMAWEARVDLPEWLRTLDIKSGSINELQRTISTALSDLESSDEEIDMVTSARDFLTCVAIPQTGWVIEETVDRRNPVGLTEMILFESEQNYIFLEVHLES